MRRFGLGIQLALLVSCGVASGYAWRAALSSGQVPQTQYIYGGKPLAPSWFFSPPSARVVPNGHASTNRHPKVRRATNAHSAAPSSSGTSTSGTKSAPASRQLASVTSSPQAASTSPAPASPTPAQKGPGHPKHHSPPRPPKPPAPPPSPPPSPPSPPAPPPATPTPPAAPVVQTTPAKGSRPGWGHGDPNHDHSGPPGKGRKSEAPPSVTAPQDEQSKGKGHSK